MEKINLVSTQVELLWDKVSSKCEDSGYHEHTARGTTVVQKMPVSSWIDGTADFFQSVKISHELLTKQLMIIQRNGNISADGDRILQRAKSTIKEIKHICRLFQMRSTFERHVEKYINARNTTEGLLKELGTLLNMFQGLDGEDIPSKIKTKINDFCVAIKESLIKVGASFNDMSAWSMLIVPTVIGNYSWFSFQKQGKVYSRSPFHQYISLDECNDISELAQEALAKIKAAMDNGILGEEDMMPEMERVASLLVPDMKLNEEGVLVCFPALAAYIASIDAGEDRDDSSQPSMEDLDFLTGAWMEAAGKKPDTSNDVFHDAKDNDIEPIATSGKKNQDEAQEVKVSRKEKKTEELESKMTSWKKELNLNVGSSNSEDDRDSIDSDRSSTIGPGASPAKLLKYAEKKVSHHKRQIRRCTGQEALLTLKSQIKDSMRKIDAYGDPDDQDLQYLYDKLDTTLDIVDNKLDDKKQREVNQRQLPRGKLLTWDGKISSFLDFKNHMKKMLTYDVEELNISTLKGQIVGQRKSEILSILYNVSDMEEAWRLLDMEYGDVLVALPTPSLKPTLMHSLTSQWMRKLKRKIFRRS